MNNQYGDWQKKIEEERERLILGDVEKVTFSAYAVVGAILMSIFFILLALMFNQII